MNAIKPQDGQYGLGMIRWRGGFNNRTGKENDYGFIETKTNDIYFNKSNILSPWEQLSASTLVMFRCTKDRRGKIVASEVGVLGGVPDEAILRFLPAAESATGIAHGISTEERLLELFFISSGTLRDEVLKRLAKSASDAILSRLAQFIMARVSADERVGLLSMLGSPVLLRQEALALRMTLPRHLHLKTLATLSTLTTHNQEAVSALRKPKDREGDESIFWNRFPPKHPKDALYPYAPEWLKKRVCKAYYATFVEQWGKLYDRLVDAGTSLDAAPIYSSLTQADRDLAALWAGKDASKAALARMLSARAAEVAAAILYRDRGCKVEDISIGQMLQRGHDWRTHDLLIDGSTSVDVKNSRRPIYNKAFYVEHTVPKFKLDRLSRNVRIAGILSPYVDLEGINKPGSGNAATAPIVYLGETHASHFEKLVQALHTPAFSLDRGRPQTIPNWLFDYPAAWYKDYTLSVRKLIDDCAWPQGDEWHYTLDDDAVEDALQRFCAIGVDAPEAITTRLHGWRAEFYAKLKEGLRTLPRLPAIYLLVMGDFIKKLSEPPPDFSPADYKPMLFPARVRNSNTIPLGTIDPLCIIERLIDALSVLWSKREALQLGRLVTFRFTGLGILQGKAIENPRWITILAYCGGSVYRKEQGRIEFDPEGKPKFLSKCGHTPLTLGVEKTCDVCRCLICDKCQFCCKKCEAVRLAKLAEDDKNNVRSRDDDPRDDPRDRPDWAASSQIGYDEGPYWLDQPPDWEIPIDAYESDHQTHRPPKIRRSTP